MERDQPSSRTIVVDNQIVDIQNLRMGADHGLDLPDKRGIRCLTKQRVQHLSCGSHTGIENKQGNCHSAPAVDVPVQPGRQQRRDQDSSRGSHITETVHGGRFHGRRSKQISIASVVTAHVALYQE